MLSNEFLNAAVILLIVLKALSAYKYGAVIRDETIFSRCDTENFKYIDEYIDMANMQFEMLMNGSVYVHGFIVVVKDIGLEDHPYSIQAFKRSRGDWVDTIYNMRGRDTCSGVFNSLEVWSIYLKDIPEQDRTCPFSKGKKFYFNTLTDITIDTVDPRAAGDYKIQILVQDSAPDEMLCFNIFADIYKQ